MTAKHKTTPFAISPAELGDEEAIAALIMELAVYEKAPQECEATPEALRKQLFGKKPAAEALVARVAGEIVGFALFFENFSTWKCRPGIYLEDLYVQPAYRKLGIGREFLRRLARVAVSRGCVRVEWSVLEWNELAHGLYRKIGAAPMTEWRVWRMQGDAIAELANEASAPNAEEDALREPPPKKTRKKKAEAAAELAPLPVPAEPPPVPDPDDVVVIHTDGGCQPNPGVGAWAAVLRAGGHVKELVGGDLATTNNRMELMAAISALETLKRRCNVEIFTDSEYVKNGITSWIAGWKRKGWRVKDGSPVKNAELWKRLEAAVQRHNVKWKWTRGHAGDPLNERCDALCTAQIAKLKRQG